MSKSQIILLVVGILAVLLLYSLPKVVVDNEEERIAAKEEAHQTETGADPALSQNIQSLKDSLSITEDPKKKYYLCRLFSRRL